MHYKGKFLNNKFTKKIKNPKFFNHAKMNQDQRNRKIERAHIIFEGHVQGIYFRAFVKENAEKLGINGWVKNLPDGSVEAVFEGDAQLINELIDICRSQHPLAVVTNVKIEWESPEGINGFKILR